VPRHIIIKLLKIEGKEKKSGRLQVEMKAVERNNDPNKHWDQKPQGPEDGEAGLESL